MTSLLPLAIPATLPKHARDYLAHLDEGITKAAASLAMGPDAMRRSAAAYREQRDTMRADEAERMADLLELDPRLYMAGCMYNVTHDGTTKYFLHLFIGLLTDQAEKRQSQQRPTSNQRAA